MKFNVPKITKILNAGDYAAELEPVKIVVWANPPKSLLNRHDAMIKAFGEAMRKRMALADEDEKTLAAEVEAVRSEMCAVFSQLWSAGTDAETHWSQEEINTLITGMADTDPQLWPWLRNRTLAMIREHRETAKKD